MLETVRYSCGFLGFIVDFLAAGSSYGICIDNRFKSHKSLMSWLFFVISLVISSSLIRCKLQNSLAFTFFLNSSFYEEANVSKWRRCCCKRLITMILRILFGISPKTCHHTTFKFKKFHFVYLNPKSLKL